MGRCCCLCGVEGYEELLTTCLNCKSASIHPYCMKVIRLNNSNDWLCEDCDQTPEHGKRPVASLESHVNGGETSEKRVANSTNMDPPPTIPPRDEKLSNRTFAGKKRCKTHHRWENPVHALAATRISKPASTRTILYGDNQMKRYEVLKLRKIRSTCYLDDEMLNTLGLRKDIEWMAEQVGWTQYLTMKEPTYPSITREFLSSVRVDNPKGLITFRLENQNRELNLEQFSNIFGFRTGGSRKKPKAYNAKEFWSEITDEKDYNPRIAKASSIHNLCFRIMQRFMASTMFARGGRSKGIVRTEELFHLWSMVQNHNVDTGLSLALQLQSVGKAKKGDIAIGGLITCIARYFDVNLEDLTQAKGNNRIDLDLIQAMRVIVHHDDGYKLKFTNTNKLWHLPCPAITTIKVRENWKPTFHRVSDLDRAVIPLGNTICHIPIRRRMQLR